MSVLWHYSTSNWNERCNKHYQPTREQLQTATLTMLSKCKNCQDTIKGKSIKRHGVKYDVGCWLALKTRAYKAYLEMRLHNHFRYKRERNKYHWEIAKKERELYAV